MLKTLKLENFKCFGRPATIPLAPITLIYGPNSGGKSSLIQSLVLMQQTLARGHGTTALVPRGELVDLGSFTSMVHRHNLENQLKISVTAQPFGRTPNEPAFSFRSLEDHEIGMQLTFGAAKSPDSAKRDSSQLMSVEYSIQEPSPPTPTEESTNPQDRSRSIRLTLEPSARQPSSFRHQDNTIAWELTPQSQGSAAEWILDTPSRSTSDPATVQRWLESTVVAPDGLLPAFLVPTATQREASSALDLQHLTHIRRALPLDGIAGSLQRALLRLSYLGPLRIHPERYYSLSNASVDTVGKTGENAPQVIFQRGKEVTDQINRWFEAFEVPYELQAKKLGDEVTGHILAITLVDQRTGVVVGPSDVGFGIGQLLPIIVEGVVSEGKTICVEQPEIHLHPRLQAHVADLLIETANLSEDASSSTPCGMQWIVETHSESLVLRLQRRIREGTLRAKDVSVLYVEPTANGSLVHELRLQADGEFLDEWPDGFFEESFNELFSSEWDD